MKKLFTISVLVFALSACSTDGNHETSTVDSTVVATDSALVQDTVAVIDSLVKDSVK